LIGQDNDNKKSKNPFVNAVKKANAIKTKKEKYELKKQLNVKSSGAGNAHQNSLEMS
jgi:hypothetical protein